MKFKPVKLAPATIAIGVITAVCLVRALHPDFLERSELMTYDMRARRALEFAPPVATNLGFVEINDASIVALQNGSVGFNVGLYWPRSVYGRLIDELHIQGARVVALDIIFGELRPDHPLTPMANGSYLHSDDFFAMQMRRAGNVILADTRGLSPPDLFSTNAAALGDISTDANKDSDGVLRRGQAFRIRRRWHPLFEQASREFGVDLNQARIEPGQIIFYLPTGDEIKVPLDASGNFNLTNVLQRSLPADMPPTAKPFNTERIWHMGIELAARELNLDLQHADVDLEHGRITLRGPNGVERVIPVDRNRYFYIDWCLTPDDRRLTREYIHDLLGQYKRRLLGETNGLANHWTNKLVVVGSSATGNDLNDRGATPIESDTMLTSQHWNVANSIITGRFIRRSSLTVDLVCIIAMGALSALLTWQLRVLVASLWVALLGIGYVVFATLLYVDQRYWLPIILPVFFSLLLTHVCLVTWRVVFEQAERRRVRSIFSKIVSPNIVQELLQAEKLSLGGARREVTVLFADVRGFTEFTESSQEMAAAYISESQLTGAAAEAYNNEQARETLNTVNTYLALVADKVKEHAGTLDKYIGDCVMAFWGAPTPNLKHASACVEAAVEAQRAVHELNRRRQEENQRREAENPAGGTVGNPPRPLLPILLLGSGINTGLATVGLMGSEAHISNYTVFGREVNLASRLETLSGRGRIIISEATYKRLQTENPVLAATCRPLPDLQKLKGISVAVRVYEVVWRTEESTAEDQNSPAAKSADPDGATLIIPRPSP